MQTIFLSIFILILLIIAVFDFKIYTIHNKLVLPLVIAGVVYQLLFGSLFSLLLGFSLGFIIGFICFVSGGMGGGDVKLMVAIGAWLGFENFILITLIASIFGLIWAMIDFIKQGKLKEKTKHIIMQLKMFRFVGFKALDVKNKDMKKPIPFGSCLVLGTMIVLFVY